MQVLEPLEFGCTYHIYNRGIDKCSLFKEKANYEHFIRLYDKYINPVANTFAWVLMKNHFHFLVKIKNYDEVKEKMKNLPAKKTVLAPFQYFSNMFNAYSKAFNKKYDRTGSLFENRFKRKLVKDIEYFQYLVLYIHNNPVNHRIVDDPIKYPWSSYMSCVTLKSATIDCQAVVGYFDNLGNFKSMHHTEMNFEDIEKWLGLGSYY
ncbi:MAG: transposase [Bacteroidota bacterium]